MDVPLELSFRDVKHTPDVEDHIRRRVDKLERFCDHINSCRVAVERPHRNESFGNPFRVRIDLTVRPGHELVVRREPADEEMHRELRGVINDAFDAAERQLKDLVERQRAEVKTHAEPLALVVRIFPDEGYGFLKTEEGREIYFHQNAVLHDAFGRLAVGTAVRFEESMGEMGPQASTVVIYDKPGAVAGSDGADAAAPPAGW